MELIAPDVLHQPLSQICARNSGEVGGEGCPRHAHVAILTSSLSTERRSSDKQQGVVVTCPPLTH